ncbi:MAG TPA: hypothetical protein VGC84_03250 [Ilumatobacteraceae bacterium]
MRFRVQPRRAGQENDAANGRRRVPQPNGTVDLREPASVSNEQFDAARIHECDAGHVDDDMLLERAQHVVQSPDGMGVHLAAHRHDGDPVAV